VFRQNLTGTRYPCGLQMPHLLIKQKSTSIVIDLRELARIHWLKDFKDLCAYLEKMQENQLKSI